MFESSFDQNENKNQDEKAEKIITPRSNIHVVDRAAMKELISSHRDGEFIDIIEKDSDTPFDERIITSEDITTRDIIEFSLHTRIAYLLQEAEKILLERNYIDINDLQNKLYALLDNYQTSHKNSSLLPSQTKFLQNSIKKIINGISETDNFLSTSSDEAIISKLGLVLSRIDPKYLEIDKTSYPGAVAVYITDFRIYNKIGGSSYGRYSPMYGIDQLEGRIFIINEDHIHIYKLFNNSLDLKVEDHEYFHFLYGQIEPEANFLTSKMKKESENKKNEVIDHNIDSAFSTFKNEFFAYYTTGSPPKNFWDLIGGDKMKNILEVTVSGRSFLSELRGIKKLVDVALQSGHSPEELSYLVVGSRSVSQAYKFIYLHMQRAGTAHSSLNSKVSDIEDA